MRHTSINGTTPLWRADLRRLNGDARAEVERLFHRALLTLDAIEEPEVSTLRTCWPRFPRTWFAYSSDPDDAPEPKWVPSPADHDMLLPVLAWGNGLTKAQWRICAHIAEGCSVQTVGDYMRLPAATVGDQYDSAITEVCRAALGRP